MRISENDMGKYNRGYDPDPGLTTTGISVNHTLTTFHEAHLFLPLAALNHFLPARQALLSTSTIPRYSVADMTVLPQSYLAVRIRGFEIQVE